MTENPIKIHLDDSTYITKVNGKLVFVRKRRGRYRKSWLSLFREVIGRFCGPKMRGVSKKPEGEKARVQNLTPQTFQSVPVPLLLNTNPNFVGAAPVQSIMQPAGPQPGIYRFGNRQLALLPLNPQGGPAITTQMAYPYPQAPWMLPHPSVISGYNFPPIDIDPLQVVSNSAPPIEVASPTIVSVAKHICAECGRLRSRKYQHENPIQTGETPTPAFCKKCQKDMTSTDESDTSILCIEEPQKQSKKAHKKKSKFESDAESVRVSIGSAESWKVSKSKQGKNNHKSPDKSIALEEQRVKHNERYRRPLYDEEEDIPRGRPGSPLLENAHSRHSHSTESHQSHQTDVTMHHLHAHHQAQRSPRESVTMEAVKGYHPSRREPYHSRFEIYDTDSTSKQSYSNGASVSSEATPRAPQSFEDPTTSTSRDRPEESSRRRRLERSFDRQGFHQEVTGLPHGVHPSEGDEVVVVTERYMVRPRPQSHAQEENLSNRRQTIMDKANVHAEKSYPQFASEAEASAYYWRDWSGVGKEKEQVKERVRKREPERMIAPAHSHTSGSSSSSRYRTGRADEDYIPRAPSPLRHLRNGGLHAQASLSHQEAPYPPSEAEALLSEGDDRNVRVRSKEVASAGRNRNIYRPPYVREATDKGTERALMPSPQDLPEILFYPNTQASEITEEIERVERHVTFRDLDKYEEELRPLVRDR